MADRYRQAAEEIAKLSRDAVQVMGSPLARKSVEDILRHHFPLEKPDAWECSSQDTDAAVVVKTRAECKIYETAGWAVTPLYPAPPPEPGEEPEGLGPILTTERGFRRVDFLDANGEECSVQESSVDRRFLWLGQNSGTHHHVTGDCLARMHLGRDDARKLIPLLEHFVDNGVLPTEPPSELGGKGDLPTDRDAARRRLEGSDGVECDRCGATIWRPSGADALASFETAAGEHFRRCPGESGGEGEGDRAALLRLVRAVEQLALHAEMEPEEVQHPVPEDVLMDELFFALDALPKPTREEARDG